MGKRLKTVLTAVFVLLLAAGLGYAAPYPDEVMKKIDDIKELEKNKKEMPESLAGVSIVKGDEVAKLKAKGAKVLDNRVRAQYDTERVEGAQLLTVDELLKNPALAAPYNKEQDVVLYCNGIKCWRSPAAAILLQHLGFKKIHWYREGLPDWKKRGLPTE
ncbi:MAG: rhodanese-like domain-containing protein [Nitrospirae bacterium]|nr:MAG: rhodanese-like domain-containing protein [Nitrospirota bacterium]